LRAIGIEPRGQGSYERRVPPKNRGETTIAGCIVGRGKAPSPRIESCQQKRRTNTKQPPLEVPLERLARACCLRTCCLRKCGTSREFHTIMSQLREMLIEPTKIVGSTRHLIAGHLRVRTDLFAQIVNTQTDLVATSADRLITLARWTGISLLGRASVRRLLGVKT